MSADLIELVQHLGQPRVLVVGDLMLDRYVWGDAERISQEAPVILLHADKREERLGVGSIHVHRSLPPDGENALLRFFRLWIDEGGPEIVAHAAH